MAAILQDHLPAAEPALDSGRSLRDHLAVLSRRRALALGVGGGLNNGAAVVLQHRYPACDIAGMIGARIDGQPKVGGKEG